MPATPQRTTGTGFHVRAMAAGAAIRMGIEPVVPAVGDSAFRNSAISAQLDHAKWSQAVEFGGNYYAGMALPDMAKECLRLEDIPAGLNTRQTIERAMSSASFEGVLSGLVGIATVAAWEDEVDTVAAWTSTRPVPDFRAVRPYAMHGPEHLSQHPRGGMAAHARFDEEPFMPYAAHRYSDQFEIDEQDIEGDRVDLLTQVPAELARAAHRTKLDLVYAILLGNPSLSDNVALLHADHGNLTALALSAANLQTAVAAMANKQSPNGRSLNIRPTCLLIPWEQWANARQVIRGLQVQQSDGQQAGGRAIATSDDLTVIADARLGPNGCTDPLTNTKLTGSASQWFLTGQRTRTIEIAHLGASPSPRVDSWTMTGRDGKWGAGFRVSTDLGVGVVGYRAMHQGNQ